MGDDTLARFLWLWTVVASAQTWIASVFVVYLGVSDMPKVNAQSSLGLFSEPSYISIGDEYDPPTSKSGRHGGLNIMTQNVKKGSVPQSTCFDRTFRRIS